jgi:hypothetical protein
MKGIVNNCGCGLNNTPPFLFVIPAQDSPVHPLSRQPMALVSVPLVRSVSGLFVALFRGLQDEKPVLMPVRLGEHFVFWRRWLMGQ